jgi:hypothetical protein
MVGVCETVYPWERGAPPYPRHLARLAEVLGVDAATLLDQIVAHAASS